MLHTWLWELRLVWVECLPGVHQALSSPLVLHTPDTVENICSLSAREVEPVEPGAQGSRSLGSMVSLRLAWATSDPILKQEQQQNRKSPAWFCALSYHLSFVLMLGTYYFVAWYLISFRRHAKSNNLWKEEYLSKEFGERHSDLCQGWMGILWECSLTAVFWERSY